MKFTMSFACDNDAFFQENGSFDLSEVSHIIRRVVLSIESLERTEGILSDRNGNTVGSWALIDDTECKQMIRFTISVDDIKSHLEDTWYDQLVESGRLNGFMRDVENALRIDIKDEIDYFVDEYGLIEY